MIKSFIKDVAAPITLGAVVYGLLIYSAFQLRPPEETPQTLIIESVDEVKINHLITSIQAIDDQMSALQEDIQEIRVEITKIRKEM